MSENGDVSCGCTYDMLIVLSLTEGDVIVITVLNGTVGYSQGACNIT